MAYKKTKDAQGTELLESPEYPHVNFLQKRIVKLASITKDVIPGVPYEKLPEGFIVQGSGRSLERARDVKTGYFKEMFDNSRRVITPQFPEEPLTELEFFCKASGMPLDEERFWAGHMDRTDRTKSRIPYTVQLPVDGRKFDLSNVKDYIDYKVVQTHVGKYIAPSWEERNWRPTYWFALVDEKVSTDRKKEEIELKLAATSEFNKIKDSRELLAEFLIIYNAEASPSASTTTEWLFNEVYKLMDKNPKEFLSIVEDPLRTEKILVHKALRAGALKKQGKKYFTLGEQSLGTLAEAITFLKDPENYDFMVKLEHQVTQYNKPII